jgi:starch phosphorylase
VRALEAVGEAPHVFHSNEGHAGFLGLERIRRLVVDEGLGFTDAVEAVRAGTVFTTHTPVPAGIDRFPRELMERYFGSFAKECGVELDELLALGREPGSAEDSAFNMAVMGLRLAGRANGVSKLHGAVSRSMFSGLWPGAPEDEVPIGSVTNGVHADTWVAPEMADVLTRHVLPEWGEAGPDRWARIVDAGDEEVFRAREAGRSNLVSFTRAHLRRTLVERGVSPSALGWCDEVLDHRALTIGFARRFATYKRATLLLSQPDRLRRLLLSPDRPVQLVFAGKAHPADEAGKDLIRQIVAFTADPEVRHRMVFLDDYDIALARMLLQGADVWLNNPRRPLEACGTSGMKAALNGALNLSILDGWWDEWFDGENGWAISSAEGVEDLAKRDEIEAESLFSLLEGTVVPLFYERREGPVRRAWIRKVKASLASLGPKVSASRMVRDYVTELYEPTAERSEALGADGFARARGLAEWKARVADAWPDVRVVDVEADAAGADVGAERDVTATVALGRLSADDVRVELLHGRVARGDELVEPVVVPLAPAGDEDGVTRFRGTISCDRSGRYGFTLRVVPAATDVITPLELGLVAWA